MPSAQSPPTGRITAASASRASDASARSSVRTAAEDIGTAWLRIVAGALAAGGVCVLLALLLARWVLRPLRELDRGVRALTLGERDAHIGDRLGPRELRTLAGSFNVMAAAVTSAAEQQSRLVADASHELRNPIARLRLTVDSLVPYVERDGQVPYGRIVAEVEELESLASGLLDLAAVLAEEERVWTAELWCRTEPWLRHRPSFDAGLRSEDPPSTAQEHRLRAVLAADPSWSRLAEVARSVDAGMAAGVEVLQARRSAAFTRFDGHVRGVQLPSPLGGAASSPPQAATAGTRAPAGMKTLS